MWKTILDLTVVSAYHKNTFLQYFKYDNLRQIIEWRC